MLARTPVDGGPQFQQPNPDGYVRLRLDPAAGSVAAVTAALALQRPFGAPWWRARDIRAFHFLPSDATTGPCNYAGKVPRASATGNLAPTLLATIPDLASFCSRSCARARCRSWSHYPAAYPRAEFPSSDQWRHDRGQVGFRRSGRRGAKYRVKYPSAQPPRPRHHGAAASTDPGVALNRGPGVRLWRFRELGRSPPVRSIAPADVWRDEAQRTAFSVFGAPIFSALRSATCAPIPPPASAASLQYSRSSVCSLG